MRKPDLKKITDAPTVQWEDFLPDLDNKLGSGAYGEVYLRRKERRKFGTDYLCAVLLCEWSRPVFCKLVGKVATMLHLPLPPLSYCFVGREGFEKTRHYLWCSPRMGHGNSIRHVNAEVSRTG